jgi:hypothetical protein
LCLALAWALLPTAPARAGDVSNSTVDETTIGTRVGAGITVGGWATLQLEAPSSPGSGAGAAAGDAANALVDDDAQRARRTRLGVSHLSAIMWWDASPVWKVLAEFDRRNAIQFPAYRDSDDGAASAPFLALERLYVDYRADDALGLRVGRFLTPIGRWNLNHADPLTWTTARPLVSRSAFPTSATGLLLSGSVALGAQGADYQVFASGRENWQSDPRSTPFDHAVGARVVLPIGNEAHLGLSVARYRRRDSPEQESQLIGSDFVWRWQSVEFSGEALARRSESSADSGERGGYLQAVLPLAPRWYATARIEAYKRSQDPGVTRSGLLGLVCRLGRHWVAKAEWVQPSGSAKTLPQGLLASMTLLF